MRGEKVAPQRPRTPSGGRLDAADGVLVATGITPDARAGEDCFCSQMDEYVPSQREKNALGCELVWTISYGGWSRRRESEQGSHRVWTCWTSHDLATSRGAGSDPTALKKLSEASSAAETAGPGAARCATETVGWPGE
jgi:hypothetical protein